MAQLHHLPSLLINPSRRIRLVSATLQSSFLQIKEVNDQFVFFLRETASSSQLENILGALLLASQDVDRPVAAIVSKVWENVIAATSRTAYGPSSSLKRISLDDTTRSSLTSFIQRAVLDPNGIYTLFNPVAPPAPSLVVHPFQSKTGSLNGSQVPTPRKDDGGDQTPRSKIDEQEENEEDRVARLRIGALGALRWLLGKSSSISRYDSIENISRCDTLPIRKFDEHIFKSRLLDYFILSRNAGLGQFRELWLQAAKRQEVCLDAGSIIT